MTALRCGLMAALVFATVYGDGSSRSSGITIKRSRAVQAPVRPGPAGKPVYLVPRFAPGQTLRYQVQFRTTTRGQSAGPVENPNAPSELEVAVAAVVRLEVLHIEPEPAPGAGPRIRMRTTYEKCSASARSDTFDPDVADIEEQYRKLESRSLEFTLDAQGKVSAVEGLQEFLPDARAAAAARDWLAQLTVAAGLPKGGIAPRQKWSAENAVTGAPLAGMVWRTESTYLRDEPCPPGSLSGETCAVILTRFELAQSGARAEATPEDYRRRGLRTSGIWSGTGESLSYVSLRTGLLVSATQDGTEDMNLTVATADGQSSVRYSGRARTRSNVLLLEVSPAPRR